MIRMRQGLEPQEGFFKCRVARVTLDQESVIAFGSNIIARMYVHLGAQGDKS